MKVTGTSRLTCLAMAGATLLAACGQTGKLYLPQDPDGAQGEVVTRPTQTPPPDPGSASGQGSNSPQTVDSPRPADTPAAVVSGSEGEKDKKDGAKTPPPESPPDK
jgi:predicted small lipoprotein YifL